VTIEAEQLPVNNILYANDWRWSAQAPPPISGQIETNTRDWATATHMFIANTTNGGLDLGALLKQIVVGSNLDLNHRTDPSRNVRYTVASVFAQSTYVDVGVTFVQSAGTLPVSGTICTLTMVVPSAALVVSCNFVQVDPVTWAGTAICPHGISRNQTYQILPGVPPLDHRAMVQSLYRQHSLLKGCGCVLETPILNATVTFTLPTGVPPGQQRYVPQQSATIVKNFFYGPGLTCSKTGAYQLVGKVQLAKSTGQGAAGLGVLVISGQPVLSVPMADETAKATANISTVLNLSVNQSINIGYESTSSAAQDVALATLTVSEVWVP
jgi:hypothetical protein